ncbi:MAG: PcfJ domain-containing protein [Lachnospiraceae bacterium]|nr:PcfJ domain-containing protein [Candidatus Colinaster scatohippi]
MLDLIIRENTWEPPVVDVSNILSDIQIQYIAGAEECLCVIERVEYIETFYFKNLDVEKRQYGEIKRFIFKEDYIWNAGEELFFEDRCLNNIACVYTSRDTDKIFKKYSLKHPEWHLRRYYTNPIRLLDHIYHCCKKNTAKEMLYKANLDELAANIYMIDELNLLSTKPADIYDGVSIKVLRCLNCKEGAVLLSKVSNRYFIKELHNTFPAIFTEKFNDAQCLYLKFLIDGGLTIGEVGRLFFARKKELQPMWIMTQFNLFLQREKYERRLADIVRELAVIDPIYGDRFLHIKDLTIMQDRICILDNLLLRRRDEFTKSIRRAIRKLPSEYQERNSNFTVRYPQTINDFCREAVYMQNCLLSYMDAVINRDTIILFVRRADSVNQPYITVEIYNNTLMQAYHRFNQDCTQEEAEWIKAYCMRHGIRTDKFRFNVDEDLLY